MILHILRTDLRRSRVSLLVYLAGLALLATLLNLPSAWQQRGTQAALWMIVMVFVASLLSANVVLADSPADSQAQWLGRPISWDHLLTAKLLYIGLAVWLPLTLVSGAMWLATFTPGQAFGAGLEIGLYVAGFPLLAAAVAAASKKLTRCIGYTFGLWGCLVVGGIISGFLRRTGLLLRPTITTETFVLAVPWAALLIGLLLTCWQFRARRPPQTLLALALLCLLLPCTFPKVKPRPPAHTALPGTLQVTSTHAPGDGQTLYHNLRVQGLSPHQFVAPRDLQIRFRNKHYNRRPDGFADFAGALIQAQLPAGSNLTWEDNGHRSHMRKLLRQAGQIGRLKGSMTLALSRLSLLGDLALEPGAMLRSAGYHATVKQDHQDAVRSIWIDYSQPQLLFAGDRDVHRRSTRALIHVAYDPSRQRGRVLRGRYSSRQPESIWPMLEIGDRQFTLEPGEERLYVFRVAVLGLHQVAFDFPEHQIQGPPAADAAADPLGMEPDTILAAVPLRSSQRRRAYEILDKELTEAHIKALVAALPRDPALARFLRKPAWVEAAREPLLAHLARRSPQTPEALLVHAAALPGADSADLRWHLIHGHKAVDSLFRELKKRPDFDADTALSKAWARRRILGKMDLLDEALAAGLPGAFEAAVREEIEHGNGRLFPLVDGFAGERADFSAWLVAHAPTLRYDPTTRRYRLPTNK